MREGTCIAISTSHTMLISFASYRTLEAKLHRIQFDRHACGLLSCSDLCLYSGISSRSSSKTNSSTNYFSKVWRWCRKRVGGIEQERVTCSAGNTGTRRLVIIKVYACLDPFTSGARARCFALPAYVTSPELLVPRF